MLIKKRKIEKATESEGRVKMPEIFFLVDEQNSLIGHKASVY